MVEMQSLAEYFFSMLKSSNMRKTVIKQYTWKSGLIAIHDFKIYDAKAHSVVKNFFTIN